MAGKRKYINPDTVFVNQNSGKKRTYIPVSEIKSEKKSGEIPDFMKNKDVKITPYTGAEKFGKLLDNKINEEKENKKKADEALKAHKKKVASEMKEDADGCVGCAFEDVESWQLPCTMCKRNCKDYWRAKMVE